MALIFGLLLAIVFVALYLIYLVLKRYIYFVGRIGTINPLAAFIGICIVAFLSCLTFWVVDIIGFKLAPKSALPSELRSYPFLYVTKEKTPVYRYDFTDFGVHHEIYAGEILFPNSDFRATIINVRHGQTPKYRFSNDVILTRVRYVRNWFENDAVGYVRAESVNVIGFSDSISLYFQYVLSYFFNFEYVLFLLWTAIAGLIWSAILVGPLPGKSGITFYQIRGTVYFAINILETFGYGVFLTPFLVLSNMVLANFAGDMLIWFAAKRFPRLEKVRRGKEIFYVSLK